MLLCSIHALYEQIKAGSHFDLLVLDIYMPDKTGIEAARELRKGGYECPIIFLTTSREHAVDAFEVDAAQYLIKPVDQTRFFTVLNKVVERIAGDRRGYLALRAGGEVRRIAIRSIVYIESQNQYQQLNLANSEGLQVRMTLAELYDAVCEFPDLVRVGSSYIVNLGYVDSLNAKVMKLTTGKEIWLPRGSYSSLKERYFAFYRSGKGKH